MWMAYYQTTTIHLNEEIVGASPILTTEDLQRWGSLFLIDKR